MIFKVLGNINRLKIIRLLSPGGRALNVSYIARELDISLKSTSKHLILLNNLDILNYKGQAGHVSYSINSDMPPDLRKVIKLLSE